MRSAAATPRSERSPPLPLCALRVQHTHSHTSTTALQSPSRPPHMRGTLPSPFPCTLPNPLSKRSPTIGILRNSHRAAQVVGDENDPSGGGAGARWRAILSRRRGSPTSIRWCSTRCRCAPPSPPHRARSGAPHERSTRIARPASIGRSVRPACARTFANPPTTDGMRLLDPFAGLNKPGLAPRGQRGALGGRSAAGRF